MRARIPGPTTTPFYASETVRAVAEIIVALLAGTSVVWKASTVGNEIGALALAIVAIPLIAINGVLRLIAARRKDRDASDRSDPKHLLAPLRVLYALVARKKHLGPDDANKQRFRVTLHRHLEDPINMHEQCVPYVGGKMIDAKKIVGRRWTNHCGIVGKVIRSGKVQRTPLGEHVDDGDKYVAELVDLYGYTEDQARQLQPMRLDSLAIPIVSDGQVIGVVYADSTDRNFFDHDTIELCIQISGAIAQHIEMTYTR